MQIIGKVVQVLPLQSGNGKNGEWRKQDVILETEERFPRKICVAFWTDRIIEAHLQIGNLLVVEADVESREFNGRWYTDVRGRSSELFVPGKYNNGSFQAQDTYQSPPPSQYVQSSQPSTPQGSTRDVPNVSLSEGEGANTDDLPF